MTNDYEFNIEKKLLELTKNMKETALQIRDKRNLLRQVDKSQYNQEEEDQSIYNTSHTSIKTIRTTSDESSSLSIKNFYRYNHELSMRTTSLNKIHLRKEKIKKQTNATLNQEVVKELHGFLDSTYKLMNLCQTYRSLKQRQRRYSPTKFKQMQVKLNLVNKQIEPEDAKDGKKKMTVYFGH